MSAVLLSFVDSIYSWQEQSAAEGAPAAKALLAVKSCPPTPTKTEEASPAVKRPASLVTTLAIPKPSKKSCTVPALLPPAPSSGAVDPVVEGRLKPIPEATAEDPLPVAKTAAPAPAKTASSAPPVAVPKVRGVPAAQSVLDVAKSVKVSEGAPGIE